MTIRYLDNSKAEIDSVLAQLGLNFEQVLALKHLNDRISHGGNRPKTEKKLSEAVKDYLERGFYSKSDRTKARYQVVLLDFLDHMEKYNGKEILMSEITLYQCEEYLLKRKTKRPGRHQVLKGKQKVAASTYNLRVAALRSLFRHCLKNDWVLDSPPGKIDYAREEQIVPNFLRLHECNVLLQVAKNKLRYQKRDYALITFMLYTGARIEEVCQSSISDIDFMRNTIILKGVKAGGNTIRERVLPLMGNLKVILEDWVQSGLGHEITPTGCLIPKKGMSTCLFPNLTAGPQYGEAMIQNNKRQILNRLYAQMNLELIKTGLPANQMKLTPHSLRHSFAILALDSGMNIMALKEFMGHKSLETTGRYLKMCPEDYRKMGEKFNPLLNFTLEQFVADLKSIGRDDNHESQ